MKPGIAKFNYFFNKLQPILTTASRQKNPGLWLYRNDGRTPLFMLEALANMYAEFHNKKKFTKIREHFKRVEDTIGAIDYYDGMAKDFVHNKRIPAEIINYLQAQSREKMQSLNEVLAENEWLDPKENRLVKIQKKLKEADWEREETEIKLMEEFYGEEIYNIVEFTRHKNFHFTDMESEVHELRRKLRWLSIYPQAVRGEIQLSANKSMPRHLAKYCTKEITGSNFNKMPDPGHAKYILVLEQNYFYSLSWMIAELGKLKDSGLQIIGVKEAIQQTSSQVITEEDALNSAYRLLGKKQPKMAELLTEAGNISKKYFGEQNIEHLVTGIKRLK